MRAVERAHAIAARLATGVGTDVRLSRTPAGYLLTAPVPDDPGRQLAALPALGLADRFGHSSRDGLVWCAVDT
ncbi:hypothetical protein ACFRKE_11175 [Kitasatospora indigofera]|uniref:hypothetical protein n=1 Tax=Kitasatospora indigofera TaxID=67307 RepID=UPI0036BA1E6B